jgi:hypothetical protein
MVGQYVKVKPSSPRQQQSVVDSPAPAQQILHNIGGVVVDFAQGVDLPYVPEVRHSLFFQPAQCVVKAVRPASQPTNGGAA